MAIIELNNASVSYRNHIALHSITMQVQERQMVGIAGPNGAGKTTLLTAINGLGNMIGGSVNIFGTELNRKSATKIRKDIGYLPQLVNHDPRLPFRVGEVVAMSRYGKIGILKKASAYDKKAVLDASRLVGIENLLERPVGHLSGGELKKVAIARALAQEPKIMLLDEPITNLDIEARQNIISLIDKIFLEKKLTIIIVMHHLDLLPANCSRIVLLKEAKLIFDGNRKGAINRLKTWSPILRNN